MELDPLDTKILAALLMDARLSLRALARRAGSTAPTVSARVQRLEEAGLIVGYTVRLDAARLPGRTRLVSGRMPKEDGEALHEAVAGLQGALEATLQKDGRFQVTLQVVDLDQEEACLAALASAGAQDVTVRPARRILGPGPAHLFAGGIAIVEPCAVCGREVGDDLVESKVDGRRVVFCCTSCRALYEERYAALRDKA